jgi:hypothetical protein
VATTNPKLAPKCLVCGTNRHINLRGMGIYLRRVSAENKIIRGPLCGEGETFAHAAVICRCREMWSLALCSRGAHAKWVALLLAPARNSSLDQVAIVPQSEFMRTKVGRRSFQPIYRFCDGKRQSLGTSNT